jgi:hypothetical protein
MTVVMTDAPAPVPSSNPSCSVCGEGMIVGNPEGVKAFICQSVQTDGLNGVFTPTQCMEFVDDTAFQEDCDCIPVDEDEEPSSSPVSMVMSLAFP